jgi:hypothetical protein
MRHGSTRRAGHRRIPGHRQAILHALGKAGCIVVGTATSESGAEAIGAGLAEGRPQGRGLMLNVNDADQVDAAIEASWAVMAASISWSTMPASPGTTC